MTHDVPNKIERPILAAGARYRWDKIREQHQIVFSEGIMTLSDSGSEIIRLCDGRPIDDLIANLTEKYSGGELVDDVHEFLEAMFRKGIVRDAPAS